MEMTIAVWIMTELTLNDEHLFGVKTICDCVGREWGEEEEEMPIPDQSQR